MNLLQHQDTVIDPARIVYFRIHHDWRGIDLLLEGNSTVSITDRDAYEAVIGGLKQRGYPISMLGPRGSLGGLAPSAT